MQPNTSTLSNASEEEEEDHHQEVHHDNKNDEEEDHHDNKNDEEEDHHEHARKRILHQKKQFEIQCVAGKCVVPLNDLFQLKIDVVDEGIDAFL